jgi:hypothetical protein
MYKYLNMALFAATLLILPQMNLSVMAMDLEENEHNTLVRGLASVGAEQEDAAKTSPSMLYSRLSYVSDVAVNAPRNIGKLMSYAYENPGKTGAFAIMGLTQMAVYCMELADPSKVTKRSQLDELAEQCNCICWPDPTSPSNPKVIGEQMDPKYCEMLCQGAGYFKNVTCN